MARADVLDIIEVDITCESYAGSVYRCNCEYYNVCISTFRRFDLKSLRWYMETMIYSEGE